MTPRAGSETAIRALLEQAGVAFVDGNRRDGAVKVKGSSEPAEPILPVRIFFALSNIEERPP